MEQWIVYTFETVTDAPHPRGTLVCHAYGPTDKEVAETAAAELRGADAALSAMVLPLEALPA